MGDLIQTNGEFKEVAGIVICLQCGDSHAALVPGSARTNELECNACHAQDSAWISARKIRQAIKLDEEQMPHV